MGQISIVTPVAPRDLGMLTTALESIASALMYLADSKTLSQAFPYAAPEIVIDGPVDDNIAAATKALVMRTFRDLRGIQVVPRVTFLADRSGPGCARNAVIADTPDDSIVFFLDADDVMYPWSLVERLFLHLLASEPILAYGQMVLLFQHPQQGMLRNIRECPNSKTLLMAQKKQNCLIPGMVCLPAGAIKDAGGFEPHLICGEDGNLFRRVLDNGLRPMSRDVPVVIYRYRENSQSKMATSNPTVATFNDKAYHLGVDWSTHGPMGQNLDPAAAERTKQYRLAEKTQLWGDMLDALAPGVAIAGQVSFTYGDNRGNDSGADPSDPHQGE